MMYLQGTFTVPAAPEKITACEACVYGRGPHASHCPYFERRNCSGPLPGGKDMSQRGSETRGENPGNQAAKRRRKIIATPTNAEPVRPNVPVSGTFGGIGGELRVMAGEIEAPL